MMFSSTCSGLRIGSTHISIGGIVYRITNVALDQLGGAREYGTVEDEIPFPLPIHVSRVSDCYSEAGFNPSFEGVRRYK